MNIELRRIVFSEPDQVRYEVKNADFEIGKDDVFIETECSVISAGTELAKYTGLQKVKYPFIPGNRAVGRVVAVGSDVNHVQLGDRVFSHTVHASHVLATRLCVPVPEDIRPQDAALVGMALVAMTSVRVGEVELGDRVAVIGMGLVGNLAAQLLQCAGAEVYAIDLKQARLDRAGACGIRNGISSRGEDISAALMELTQGKGVDVVVEASGAPEAAELAATLTGHAGEGTVVLLGSPRRDYATNLTPYLNEHHLWRNGCVKLRGAHEWRYPLYETPFQKHSMERNAQIIFRLIAEGKLQTEPLITHVYKPDEAEKAFQGLKENPDEFVGVEFDWR